MGIEKGDKEMATKKFLLHCKDLGNADCARKFTGYNEGEVLMKTIQHIMWDHKVEKVTPEEKDRIRSLIKSQE
jgi:predicted small metal-binding protein